MLRIAGLQHPGVLGDVEANLRVLEEAAVEAAGRGAGLLVTPEMFLTGYAVGPRSARESAALPLTGRVAGIARRTGLALVAGLPLPGPGGGVTNSLVLLDADGRLVLRYDKTHLFGDLDRSMFTAGDTPSPVVEVGGVRIAFLICYDVEFPETVRAAALAGADLVVVPTAQMEPFAFVAEHLVRVRAWENQVHVAYVNRTGTEGDLTYVGRSSVVAPSGEVLAAADGTSTALLVADVDPALVAAARAENPYLQDRRPALYPEAGPPATAGASGGDRR